MAKTTTTTTTTSRVAGKQPGGEGDSGIGTTTQKARLSEMQEIVALQRRVYQLDATLEQAIEILLVGLMKRLDNLAERVTALLERA